MRIGDRYVEVVLYRLRLLLSIEAVCTAALIWASLQIADRLDIGPPMSLRLSRPELHMLYQIGWIVIMSLQAFAVYGAGEFVRRKFKLKSLLFF